MEGILFVKVIKRSMLD